MPARFQVPKFITIEDKIAGLLTFKQLFSLLGAFILTWLVFKIDSFTGVIVGIISFGVAISFTFLKINGKALMYVFPSIVDYFFRDRKFVWQRMEKFAYKDIKVPEFKAEELESETTIPIVKKREKRIVREKPKEEKVVFEIQHPEVEIKEEVAISLDKPIAEQINQKEHSHLTNPKNPYRVFPYIKFYRALK